MGGVSLCLVQNFHRVFPKYVFICFVILSIQSCGIYRTNDVVVPQFQHKGQVYTSFSGNAGGWNAHAGYAFSQHFAVLGKAMVGYPSKFTYSDSNYTDFKEEFYEFGLGYFQKDSSNWTNEFYLLGGRGYTLSNVASVKKGLESKKADFTRITAQFNFGKSRKHLGFLISPNIQYLQFNTATNNSAPMDINKYYFLVGCAATFFVKLPYGFKVSIQQSSFLPVSFQRDEFTSGVAPFDFSFGISKVFGR